MLTSQHTLLQSIAVTFVLMAHSGQAQNNTAGQNVTPANVIVQSHVDPTTSLSPATYRVHAYMSETGKLQLFVTNPERLRYKIEVVDGHNRSLYEEFTNHNQYNRRLDLSALPENSCQVIVKIDNKRYQYKVRRQEARFAFTVQAQPVVNQQMIDEPSQNEPERSATPVTLN